MASKAGRLRAGLAAAALTAALVAAGAALAATGDVTYRDCISGESQSAACALVPGAGSGGTDTGLNGLDRVEMSRDGTSVYAASSSDDAIVHLTRNPETGAVVYSGCITGDAAITPCTPIPGASAMGNTGLDGLDDLKVSPDGTSLYAIAGDDTAVVRFSRDPASGALTFASCISGETQTSGTCTQIPLATSGGTNSGFEDPQALALSLDGRSLYVLSYGDQGVASFETGSSGELIYRGCLTADSLITSCAKLPGAAPDGDNTGFDSQQAIAISVDGRSVYTVDDADEAIAHFDRDPSTGTLSFVGCLTADSTIANCAKVPGATPSGIGTGLRSLVHVSTSPDGNSVYAVGDSERSVIHYRRDPGSGALSFESCDTGSTTGADLCTPIPAGTSGAFNSGMQSAVWAAIGPDGRSVDVTAAGDDAVARFVRDPLTGALTYAGCISAETESAAVCAQIPGAASMGANTGLDEPRSLVASPDGRSLYAAAQGDDSITRFDREPDSTGPVVELAGKKKQRAGVARRAKSGKVKLTATCTDEFCTTLSAGAKLKLKLDGKRKRAGFKPVTFADLQAGEPAPLTLKPKRKAKRLLKQAGKGKVAVKVTGSDLLDNETVARKRVKLKRRR